jgi:hypothetical protein
MIKEGLVLVLLLGIPHTGGVSMDISEILGPNEYKEFNRKEVIYLILASIAYEEFALAKILNVEAEKMQDVSHSSYCELQEFHKGLNETLQNVIIKEIILLFKMEKAMNFECPKKHDEEC